MKRVAILQSNYIPWRGCFDLIASVDEFVLYDDAQYTPRDWRNRNRIKTPQGAAWLTVPVRVKGRRDQRIRDTEIDGTAWAATHWKSIEANYRRAPWFDAEAAWLAPLYRESFTHLSALNRRFLDAVCRRLGIATPLTDSAAYALLDGRSERLAGICEQAGAGVYVSGPAARAYLDETVFARRGIAVEWFDYAGFPPYAQLWDGFDPHVTVLDVLFNTGPQAARHVVRHPGPVAAPGNPAG